MGVAVRMAAFDFMHQARTNPETMVSSHEYYGAFIMRALIDPAQASMVKLASRLKRAISPIPGAITAGIGCKGQGLGPLALSIAAFISPTLAQHT